VQSSWAQYRYDASHSGNQQGETVINTADVKALAQAWDYPTGTHVNSSVASVAGIAYVGADGGRLFALNTHTGAEVWTADAGGAITGSPAVVGGVAYVGAGDGTLYTYDAATGVPGWQATTGGAIASSPAVIGGSVFIGSGDHNLYAFNATTGAKIQNGLTFLQIDQCGRITAAQ
jgi:outer membrane protein assembly factor BamB